MPNRSSISRRAFVGSLGLAARAGAAPFLGPWQTPADGAKVINCHDHLSHRSRPAWREDDRKVIDAADKLGIDQLCCSILTPGRPATVEGFRECNQIKIATEADLAGMRQYPPLQTASRSRVPRKL